MNPEYAIASYVIALGTIVGYVLWLWRKQRILEEELVAVDVEAPEQPARVSGVKR